MCSLCLNSFPDKPYIQFLEIKPEILETKLAWLETEQKGKWVKSTELDPLQPHGVKKRDLYTSEEKKKIKPNENCVTMFLKSNTKADNIYVKSSQLGNTIGKSKKCHTI